MIKESCVSDNWEDKPAKLYLKDRNAHWTVKFTKAKPKNVIWYAGHNGNVGGTAHPACDFRGIPPAAIVHAVPEFIWGMSAYTKNIQFCIFRKRVRTSIIAGIKLFHINTAPTLRAQGRSGQSTLSDDPALQAPARSTRERGVRGSSSSSRWWLLLVGLIAAVLCVPFIRTVLGWAMRVYC